MIKSSGVKNTFYILISILILFWLVTSLVFLDRWNRQSHYSSIRDEISDLKYNFSHYCDLNKLSQITTSSFHPATGEKMEEIDRLNSEMVASLDLIETDYIFSRNTPVVRKIRTFRENLTEINLLVNEYTALIKQAGSMTSGTLARTRDILEVLKEIPGVDFWKSVGSTLRKHLRRIFAADYPVLAPMGEKHKYQQVLSKAGNTFCPRIKDSPV